MIENENQSRECSIDIIDLENNLEEVLEPGPGCCIYRVPQYLRKINEDAYTPSCISIGPLHYGRRELMGMEKQKIRLLSKFRERVGAQKLEEFKTYIQNQEQLIRNHYSVTSKLQKEQYVKVILRDVVFIIELFVRNDRGTRDFLLDNAQQKTYLIIDLLLLENQIPYFVLNHLYSSAFPSSEGHPSFLSLCLNFFKFDILQYQQPKHFTDLHRHTVVGELQPTEQSSDGPIIDLPCATKLNKSGLEFKDIEERFRHKIILGKRKLRKWLPWFEVNELQIPRIEISDETERELRNLMALEIFHYSTQTYICHYANLMDHLIDTVKDVDFLTEKRILINHVGDIETIAKMFNRLCSHISLEDSPYYEDVEKMKAHYNNPWNHLKATLKSVYFNNLWKGTATVAAAFLLLLTAIQTFSSIKQF